MVSCENFDPAWLIIKITVLILIVVMGYLLKSVSLTGYDISGLFGIILLVTYQKNYCLKMKMWSEQLFPGDN